jgi:uncharacterized protein
MSQSSNSFIVDVTALLRGSSQHIQVEIDSDYKIINPKVAQISPDTSLFLKATLLNAHNAVIAQGEIDFSLHMDCSRCAEPFDQKFHEPLEGIYFLTHSIQDQDDHLYVDNETVDLFTPVNDTVILSIPFQPLCRTDCAGLCPECGIKLNQNPEHTHEK